MKHIKLFEEWSPEFNKTLQGAYNKAKTTNRVSPISACNSGKAAKAVLDYANRSQEVFSAESKNGDKITFTLDPDFILNLRRGHIPLMKKISSYLLIPIILKSQVKADSGNSSDYPVGEKGLISFVIDSGKGKMFLFPKRDLILNGLEQMGVWAIEFKFSDIKSIENFFSMIIQAVLSSKEADGWGEPEAILQTIQKVVLDRDMREFTM